MGQNISHASTYQDIYPALDPARKEIRLLILHPVQRHQKLRCSLRTISLLDEKRPQYETISYHWGSSEVRDDIIVDGLKAQRPLNTCNALRCFRRKYRDRVLWIDAVCINQSNIEERGQQVGMMGDIYRGGIGNLIYLGEEDEYTQRAFRCVEALVRRYVPDDPAAIALFSQHERSVLSTSPSEIVVDDYALNTLFVRPWFRLWVLQEAALARTNTASCGKRKVRLLTLLRAAAWLTLHFSISGELRTAVKHAACTWLVVDWKANQNSSLHLYPLEFLLWACGSYVVTEPRDNVFGMTGLYQMITGREVLPIQLQPDYTRNCADVFRDATRLAILESGRLAIFNVSAGNRRDSDCNPFAPSLPSWVPSWFRKLDPQFDLFRFSPFFDVAGKVENLQSVVIAAGDPACLHLSGYEVDYVTELSDIIRADAWNDVDVLHQIIRQVGILDGRSEESSLQDSLSPEPAMTLIGGVNWRGQEATWEDAGQHVDLIQWTIDTKAHPALYNLTPQSSKLEISAARYLEAMSRFCTYRKYFETADGVPGVGPATLTRGDIVTIFAGGKVPYAIGPRDAGGYEMIGQCYLHGIMHGEFAEKMDWEGKELRTFELW